MGSNSTLSNCYVPLPSSSRKNKITINPSSRPSGGETNRNSKSLRHICIDRHILANSTGSSLIELGHTKILCNVHGPRPINPSTIDTTDVTIEQGVLNCQVRYAPNFGIRPETKVITTPTNLDGFAHTSSSANSAQETELSSRLNDCIAPSVPLHLLMKNVVDVFIMVLQDDGAVFPACVVAASLALADSGIETYGLVSAFSVAVIPKQVVTRPGTDSDDGDVEMEEDEDGQGVSKSDPNYRILADPNARELLVADAVLTVAMMKSWKEVVFWDQAGSLPPAVANEASDLCQEGCTAMHKFMRQALVG